MILSLTSGCHYVHSFTSPMTAQSSQIHQLYQPQQSHQSPPPPVFGLHETIYPVFCVFFFLLLSRLVITYTLLYRFSFLLSLNVYFSCSPYPFSLSVFQWSSLGPMMRYWEPCFRLSPSLQPPWDRKNLFWPNSTPASTPEDIQIIIYTLYSCTT